MKDEMWQAIVNNDSSFDGKFYYAVATTGIFCRPSCKSRTPDRANVRIYHYVQQAVAEKYRPCKRCKPDGRQLPDEEWIGRMVEWIDSHYTEDITLATLAAIFHGSPYHMQRTFKRVKRVSPSEYIRQKRIAKAQQYLSATDRSVVEIALAVGMPNAAHFATVFHTRTGHTPTEYRQLNIANTRA